MAQEKDIRPFLLKEAMSVLELNAGEKQGSAVLLFLEETGKTGIFVSCYHIVQGTSWLQIRPCPLKQEEGRIVWPTRKESTLSWLDSRKSPMEICCFPEYDLVFIRASLPLDWPDELYKKHPWDLTPEKEIHLNGVALGYPAYNRTLYPIYLRIGDISPRAEYFLDVEGSTKPCMKFRYLNSQATAPGMSGGLILDEKGRFSGILFGSMPRYNIALAICSQDIMKIAQTRLHFQAHQSLSFQAASLLPKEIEEYLHCKEIEDCMEWQNFQSWQEYFGDAGAFRKSFQEIRLPWIEGSNPSSILIRLDEKMKKELLQKEGELKIWFHGREHLFTAENCQEALILKRDFPSLDNLIVMHRERGPGEGKKNWLDSLYTGIHLEAENHSPLHLVRTLPALVSGYNVYVHVYTPPSASIKPAKNKAGYLYIQKDFCEDLLKEVPFTFDLDSEKAQGKVLVCHHESLSQFSSGEFAKIQFQEENDLEAIPSPRIFVETAQKLYIDRFRQRLYGFNLDWSCKQGLTFSSRMCIQFLVNPQGGWYCMPRIVDAQTSESIFVPLLGGENLQVNMEISSLVKEIAVEWFNNARLQPRNPRKIFPAIDITKNGKKKLTLELKTIETQKKWIFFGIEVQPESAIMESPYVPLSKNPSTAAELRFPSISWENLVLHHPQISFSKNPKNLVSASKEPVVVKNLFDLVPFYLNALASQYQLDCSLGLDCQNLLDYFWQQISLKGDSISIPDQTLPLEIAFKQLRAELAKEIPEFITKILRLEKCVRALKFTNLRVEDYRKNILLKPAGDHLALSCQPKIQGDIYAEIPDKIEILKLRIKTWRWKKIASFHAQAEIDAALKFSFALEQDSLRFSSSFQCKRINIKNFPGYIEQHLKIKGMPMNDFIKEQMQGNRSWEIFSVEKYSDILPMKKEQIQLPAISWKEQNGLLWLYVSWKPMN